MTDPPQFPAGAFDENQDQGPGAVAQAIDELAGLPGQVRRAIEGLDDRQLDTRYRNWTIRQIVHHLADSHINAYVRFKLALTEDCPTIRPYDETRWAELGDARTADPALSLAILDSVHGRWDWLLRGLSPTQLEKRYDHPEYRREFTLQEATLMYAWHGRHHTSQILWRRGQEGW